MNILGKKTNKPLLPVAKELNYPFDLKRYLKQQPSGFDLVPVLDMIVIALLFSLLFTRYLVFPGVRVELPQTALLVEQEASNVEVLTIDNNGMLFFEGGIYSQNSIEGAFRQYFASNRSDSSVLLLKARAALDIQQFLDLCQIAQSTGFAEVQIASDPSAIKPGITIDTLSDQSNRALPPLQ